MAGLSTVIALFETPAVPQNIQDFFTIATGLITQILTWLTQMTTWVLGDGLASLFFAIMLLMLAIHVLHSLIKFS